MIQTSCHTIQASLKKDIVVDRIKGIAEIYEDWWSYLLVIYSWVAEVGKLKNGITGWFIFLETKLIFIKDIRFHKEGIKSRVNQYFYNFDHEK